MCVCVCVCHKQRDCFIVSIATLQHGWIREYFTLGSKTMKLYVRLIIYLSAIRRLNTSEGI